MFHEQHTCNFYINVIYYICTTLILEPGQNRKIAALTINRCVCFLFEGEKMNKYMEFAIKLAKIAFKKGDIPVGAVIIKNNKIISHAYNTKHKVNDPTAHAEILAIRKACKILKTTYLSDCTIYVTLEPCMMCSAAILQSHISEVVFCVKSPKFGYLNHICDKVKTTQLYDSKYEQLLKDFFIDKR